MWEHGEKRGNGWKCNYCHQQRNGGGATRLKEHLAQRGKDAKDCPSVPLEVKTFFNRELDRIRGKRMERERSKMRADEAARSSYVHLEDEEDDPDMQEALHQSRQEFQFQQKAGPRYERGGGSGSGGGPRLTRSQTQIPQRLRDFHLATVSGPRQSRIDTGPWTNKGRSAKERVGKAWAKALHALGIPGRKVDDPYFRAAIIETQNQGELMCCCNAGVCINQNIELIHCSNAGVGVQLPTGKEIDGKYLDATITEIEKEIEKWKAKWPQHGLTIMCDSWTGVSRNSVVNFLIYSNGMMYFWKSVDATGVVQDHAFLLTVCSQLTRPWDDVHFFIMLESYILLSHAGDQKNCT